MKSLVLALGLYVLWPSSPVLAAPHLPVPKERQCTVEPRTDPADPQTWEDLAESRRTKHKHKKKKATKPQRLMPLPSPTTAEVRAYVQSISAVDPLLVLSICRVESNFHTMANARGGGSAHYGLMQIAPATARAMGFKGKPSDLYDWRINVRFGARYLAYLQAQYGRLTDQTIASYNSGTPYYHYRTGHPPRLINAAYVALVRHYYAIYSAAGPT